MTAPLTANNRNVHDLLFQHQRRQSLQARVKFVQALQAVF